MPREKYYQRSLESSEGFDDETLAAIIDSADQTTVRLIGRGDDPLFMGRLVRVLVYTGVHITNLVGRRSQERWRYDKKTGEKKRVDMASVEALSSRKNLYDHPDGKGGTQIMLMYRRVKKRTDNRVDVPVSKHLMPWLPEFLDQAKPGTRARYNQLLADLEQKIFKDRGIRVHLNPHRFRHTCMRLLHKEFGLTTADIMRITGTTEQTVVNYAQRSSDDIAKELREKGW